jgi:predicted deacylase
MTMAVHKVASNGAVVSTYTASTPGPSTLLVAGQHGNELGPVRGVLGWDACARKGRLTIIRTANAMGVQLGTRYYLQDGKPRDLNREWGVPGTLAQELWELATEDGVPEVVLDLHSSPDHRDRGLGLLVLAADDGASLAVADQLVHALSVAETGWRTWAPGSWELPKMEGKEYPGALYNHAARQGCAAVTVEFSDGYHARVPVLGQLPEEYVSWYSNIPSRRRSIHEQMLGVHALLNWVEARHR